MVRIGLVLALILIIGGCGYWIYKNYFSNFSPDVNDVQFLPADVNKIETEINQNPKFATSSANPLSDPLISEASAAAHFRIPILMYHYVEHVKDKNDRPRISLNTLPEVLDLHIKTLKYAQYT